MTFTTSSSTESPRDRIRPQLSPMKWKMIPKRKIDEDPHKALLKGKHPIEVLIFRFKGSMKLERAGNVFVDIGRARSDWLSLKGKAHPRYRDLGKGYHKFEQPLQISCLIVGRALIRAKPTFPWKINQVSRYILLMNGYKKTFKHEYNARIVALDFWIWGGLRWRLRGK